MRLRKVRYVWHDPLACFFYFLCRIDRVVIDLTC